MPKTITDFVARNRLKITRIVIIVCVIGMLLNGITRTHFQYRNATIFIIGSILVILGNLIRSWAAGIVHKGKILAETGPYSLWRHPLYFGSAMIALGFGLLLNDPFCWAGIILLFLIVYPSTIKKEENDMRNTHGQHWDDFAQKVGYIIPKHIDFAKIFDRWSSRQWAKNKEYNSLITSFVVWLVIWILGLL
jgi:protein-S-isoprenylcysteine O-methyltransferase Ste14|nr:hypothetical protein [Candidatus Cloacimonadota bacterium]